MDVIILAGGLGTRLKNVVKDIPKVMADINGKPLLEYTFKYLEKYDVKNIILAVGYKAEVIEKYFGNNYNGINIIYSKEHIQLGTGGAIKKALNYTNEKHVIVMNGDLIVNIDLEELYKSHLSNENISATLAIKEMKNYDRFGTIISENSYVKEFKEKKYTKIGDINVGVYVINKEKYIEQNKEDIFGIEKDYFERISGKKHLYTYRYDKQFLDIGIEEDYKKAKDIINENFLNI